MKIGSIIVRKVLILIQNFLNYIINTSSVFPLFVLNPKPSQLSNTYNLHIWTARGTSHLGSFKRIITVLLSVLSSLTEQLHEGLELQLCFVHKNSQKAFTATQERYAAGWQLILLLCFSST